MRVVEGSGVGSAGCGVHVNEYESPRCFRRDENRSKEFFPVFFTNSGRPILKVLPMPLLLQTKSRNTDATTATIYIQMKDGGLTLTL